MSESVHNDRPALSVAARASSPAGLLRRLLSRRATVPAVAAPADLRLAVVQPELLGAELHRLRRVGTPSTIRIHGGHLHRGVRVEAVHRRHARLTDSRGHRVLVPRAFIEAVAS